MKKTSNRARRSGRLKPRGVRFIQSSGNDKLSDNGQAATTYAAIAGTCPISCELRGAGCYGEGGRLAMLTKQLNAEAYGMTDTELAQAEADAIDRGGIAEALRLHTFGDARTEDAATILGQAATRWRHRGGGPVFTYTHAGRDVSRLAWGPDVSVLGSVDRLDQVEHVVRRGYAPARYVAHFPNGRKAWTEAEVRWVPCPNQTFDDVTCMKCRLCFDADALATRRVGIAFTAHGTKAGAIKRRLEVLR